MADHAENAGAIALGGLALAGAGVFFMFQQHVVSEMFAGLTLACAVAAVAAGVLFRAASDAVKTPADRSLAVLMAVATFVVAGGFVILSVSPGSPAAHGELRAAGESVALPADLGGAVRVLVHADLPGQDDADIAFELSGAELPLKGHLVRKVGVSRGRKGAAVRTSSEQNSEFLVGDLGAGGKTLKLASLTGALRGPLTVTVFHDRMPVKLAYAIALAFVILATAITARKRWKDSAAFAAGLAAVFGVVVFTNGTPDAVIRPEIGALLLSPFLGGLGGMAALWIMRRFVKAA